MERDTKSNRWVCLNVEIARLGLRLGFVSFFLARLQRFRSGNPHESFGDLSLSFVLVQLLSHRSHKGLGEYHRRFTVRTLGLFWADLLLEFEADLLGLL